MEEGQKQVWESVIFHHVGPWDPIHITMPGGGKHLSLLGCLASPLICVFILREVKDEGWRGILETDHPSSHS